MLLWNAEVQSMEERRIFADAHITVTVVTAVPAHVCHTVAEGRKDRVLMRLDDGLGWVGGGGTRGGVRIPNGQGADNEQGDEAVETES